MNRSFISLLCAVGVSAFAPAAEPENPRIDPAGFARLSAEALAQRRDRRLSEEAFLRLSREPGTIILDARSREKFDLRHIRGAINLSFPDIDVASLAKALPDKATRILIYCNNNFEGDPLAFAYKISPASLNLSTYIALHSYGYSNVYELAPLLEVKTTILPLVGAAGSR